jgi:hypothetical protein
MLLTPKKLQLKRRERVTLTELTNFTAEEAATG